MQLVDVVSLTEVERDEIIGFMVTAQQFVEHGLDDGSMHAAPREAIVSWGSSTVPTELVKLLGVDRAYKVSFVW